MGKKAQKKENRKMILHTLKFMLSVTKKEKPSLFFVYLLRFVAQIIQKVNVVLLPKFLMDELVLIVDGAPLSEHQGNLILYVSLIGFFYLISNFMSSLENQLRDVTREWFNEYFEVVLAKKTMDMDFEQTEDPAALDSLNRAKEGISWYSGGVVGVLDEFYNLASNIAVILGVGTIILVTCPLLFPVQLFALFLMGFMNGKANRVEIEFYARLSGFNRIFGYYLFQLSDFSYGKEIRLYDSEEMMLGRSLDITEESVKLWKRNTRKQRSFNWVMDIGNVVRDGFSYFYMGFLTLIGKITLGELTMCVASASELYMGMRGVIFAWQNIMKRCDYANRFIEFLQYPDSFQKGTQKIQEGKHVIEFCNVTFRYPRTEKDILKNINLRIESGEHLSIVGLNGAGKTTFIKLLCRLYDVTEGVIKIDGVDIKSYSEEVYRKLFAVVFQDFKLFAFTLRENITFGKQEDDEVIDRMLKESGVYEDAMKLSKGLDTVIYKSFDEDGTELSGGQQQKTAISRALYKNAPIVILDEPTAALDPVAEYEIYQKFESLVGNKTAIYISHRLSSCKFCDRIAVFSEGTVKEYGTHEELVKKKDGIYAEMFATQAQYYIDAETGKALG